VTVMKSEFCLLPKTCLWLHVHLSMYLDSVTASCLFAQECGTVTVIKNAFRLLPTTCLRPRVKRVKGTAKAKLVG
jgi:hypothetical protein